MLIQGFTICQNFIFFGKTKLYEMFLKFKCRLTVGTCNLILFSFQMKIYM